MTGSRSCIYDVQCIGFTNIERNIIGSWTGSWEVMLRPAISRQNGCMWCRLVPYSLGQYLAVFLWKTGIHPAHSGMASLPFVDELDWSTVDAVLITQWDIFGPRITPPIWYQNSFHLDHAASLTYIMEKVCICVELKLNFSPIFHRQTLKMEKEKFTWLILQKPFINSSCKTTWEWGQWIFVVPLY